MGPVELDARLSDPRLSAPRQTAIQVTPHPTREPTSGQPVSLWKPARELEVFEGPGIPGRVGSALACFWEVLGLPTRAHGGGGGHIHHLTVTIQSGVLGAGIGKPGGVSRRASWRRRCQTLKDCQMFACKRSPCYIVPGRLPRTRFLFSLVLVTGLVCLPPEQSVEFGTLFHSISLPDSLTLSLQARHPRWLPSPQHPPLSHWGDGSVYCPHPSPHWTLSPGRPGLRVLYP